MTIPAELLERARSWLEEDPDARTRSELEGLLERARGTGDDADEAAADVADRFAGVLEFGTAGLRGALGAGPNRMNRVVVTRAAAGLSAYLLEHGATADDTVVIGYDARHDSDVFARDTAEVVAGAGLRPLLLPRPLPTPVVAYAIRHLGCVAGVVVTASHNPPQDNGYKVYLGDGSQIVPPADADIAAAIEAVGPLAEVPRSSEVATLSDNLVEDYLDAVVGLAHQGAPRDLVVVYTPLHGVGGDLVTDVLRRAGFAAPHVVSRQEEPDPDFPTVSFPNPEEPGAMDLLLDLARREGADVAIANDPDADRLAVAVPAADAAGGWRALSGDEIGTVLGDWLLEQTTGSDRLVATTIVSSSLLGKLAAEHGVAYAETLTGFKWLARAALARPDLRPIYAYEEALGSCVGDVVRDKDGISAALAFAGLVAAEKAAGRTVLDRLADVAARHGHHVTRQLSIRYDGPGALDRARAVVDRLAASPPASLGGAAVVAVEDLRPGGVDGLPPSDVVRLRLDGGRVIVRPSGTEPKLKAYVESVDADEGAARDRLAAVERALPEILK